MSDGNNKIKIQTSAGAVLLEVKEMEGREWVSLIAFKDLVSVITDLNKELDGMRKGKVLAIGELEEISRIRQEHLEMKKELDQLTVFIREQYKKEIELGQHANIKTSVEAAIMYMGRERISHGRT